MASAPVDGEIERLTRDLQILENEISVMSQRSRPSYHPGRSLSPCESPPPLKPFGVIPSRGSAVEKRPRSESRNPKRKEIEARRYSGKEPIAEYLLQFELTARRNGWTDPEKAVNLLCALDGPARNLLAEVDIDAVAYSEVRDLLTKRFGPVLLPEVHEQALQDLKLSRGQPIREMTTEVTRLVKLAYPEFDEAARDRFAIKALINSIPDRDTAFYVKEKDPRSLEEVCTLYERYKVLTGHTVTSKPATVKGVKPPEQNEENSALTKDQLLEIVSKQAEGYGKQLAQLTESISQLIQSQQRGPPVVQAHAPPLNPGPAPSSLDPGRLQRLAVTGVAPRQPNKPCPKCRQPGHWMRDCPFPEVCFSCGQSGHLRRDCKAHLNGNRPTSAPHAGPPPHHY